MNALSKEFQVVVDEGITQVSYALDEGLIEFGTAMDDGDFDRLNCSGCLEVLTLRVER